MTRDERDWQEWAQWAEQNRRDAALRGDLTIVRDNRADDELTDAERAILAQNEAELRAPTASDTAAELARLRDENARANRQLDEMGIEHSGRTLDERLSEMRDRLSSAMHGRVDAVKRAREAEQELARLRARVEMAEAVIGIAAKVLAVRRSNPEMHDRLARLSSAIADYRETKGGDAQP